MRPARRARAKLAGPAVEAVAARAYGTSKLQPILPARPFMVIATIPTGLVSIRRAVPDRTRSQSVETRTLTSASGSNPPTAAARRSFREETPAPLRAYERSVGAQMATRVACRCSADAWPDDAPEFRHPLSERAEHCADRNLRVAEPSLDLYRRSSRSHPFDSAYCTHNDEEVPARTELRAGLHNQTSNRIGKRPPAIEMIAPQQSCCSIALWSVLERHDLPLREARSDFAVQSAIKPSGRPELQVSIQSRHPPKPATPIR